MQQLAKSCLPQTDKYKSATYFDFCICFGWPSAHWQVQVWDLLFFSGRVFRCLQLTERYKSVTSVFFPFLVFIILPLNLHNGWIFGFALWKSCLLFMNKIIWSTTLFTPGLWECRVTWSLYLQGTSSILHFLAWLHMEFGYPCFGSWKLSIHCNIYFY